MRAILPRLLTICALAAAPGVLAAQRTPAPSAATAPRAPTSGNVRARSPIDTAAPEPRRRRPWVRNAVTGAVIGGAVGYGLGHSACDRCDDPAPIYAAAALGAGTGAILGLVVTLSPRGAQLALGRRSSVTAPAP